MKKKPQSPNLRLVREHLDCTRCDAYVRCLRSWLDPEALQAISDITETRGPYEAGSAIYRMESPFRSLFIIQQGAVKTESALDDGNLHVSGFHFPGELIGLESIGERRYNHDAIALERTWACELPFTELESLCNGQPRLQHVLVTLLGQRVRQSDGVLLRDRYQGAEKRLLLFFQSLCERNLAETHNGRCKLELPMSKTDIASHLGLRPESVSRALGRLQQKGLIRNHMKTIEFLDIDRVLAEITK